MSDVKQRYIEEANAAHSAIGSGMTVSDISEGALHIVAFMSAVVRRIEAIENYNVASCVDDTPQMTLPNGDTLSEGDYGVTRDGRKVGPIEISPYPGSFYKFKCEGSYYGHNGLYRDSETTDDDIIAKWVDTPTLEDDMTPEQTDYNDGNWHGWNGGECPVHRESEVEVAWSVQADISAYGSHRASSWDWNSERLKAFRVTKPYVEPKVETVTAYAQPDLGGDFEVSSFCSHWDWVITFNTIDGKPDTASIKMEKL